MTSSYPNILYHYYSIEQPNLLFKAIALAATKVVDPLKMEGVRNSEFRWDRPAFQQKSDVACTVNQKVLTQFVALASSRFGTITLVRLRPKTLIFLACSQTSLRHLPPLVPTMKYNFVLTLLVAVVFAALAEARLTSRSLTSAEKLQEFYGRCCNGAATAEGSECKCPLLRKGYLSGWLTKKCEWIEENV